MKTKERNRNANGYLKANIIVIVCLLMVMMSECLVSIYWKSIRMSYLMLSDGSSSDDTPVVKKSRRSHNKNPLIQGVGIPFLCQIMNVPEACISKIYF